MLLTSFLPIFRILRTIYILMYDVIKVRLALWEQGNGKPSKLFAQTNAVTQNYPCSQRGFAHEKFQKSQCVNNTTLRESWHREQGRNNNQKKKKTCAEYRVLY